MRISYRSITPACLLLLARGLPGGAQEIETVVVDGPPVWGEDVRVVEEVRIGTVLGAAEYAFGLIGSVAVTDAGTIWVGDRQLGALRRYRPDGTYIDQIGREGEGPGEFEYPFGMRVLADGSVAVWDDGLLRVTRFTDDGTYIDSFSPPTHRTGGNVEEFEVDAEGNLYILATNLASLSREFDPRNIRRFWLDGRRRGDRRHGTCPPG